MTLRDLLVRLYPRGWRAEYGGEFAAVLASRTMNMSTIADVLWGAARQQWRERSGWLILLLAGIVVSTANQVAPFGRRGGPLFGLAILVVSVVAAYRARMRGGSGYGAALKAFLLCWGADLVLAELVCLRLIAPRPVLCFHSDLTPNALQFTSLWVLTLPVVVCVPATLAWILTAVRRRLS